VNPQAIIAALPWLRRLWRIMPGPLRVPVLLIAAAIGVWQFIQGRKDDGGEGDGGGSSDGPPPAPSDSR
jgi:hypothetical protein